MLKDGCGTTHWNLKKVRIRNLENFPSFDTNKVLVDFSNQTKYGCISNKKDVQNQFYGLTM